jgi:putative tricarboxylic transport membrane protein
MKRKDLIGGLFFMCAGIVFAVYARSVDIGTWEEPGPGFLPFYGGALMIFMTAILVAGNLFKKAAEAVEPFFSERDSWKRVGAVSLSLIGFNLLLKPLGFVLVTFLFVGFLVRFIFPQGWIKSIVTAFLATACARIIFVNFLEINFPKGILGF